jgi:small subunit ribosomal protein S15
MLTKEAKKELFQEYSIKQVEKDSGSSESQVALFTHRIKHLTEHLKLHPKDKASRLGLVKLVGKRKKQLGYLQNGALERYRSLIAKLGLRK